MDDWKSRLTIQLEPILTDADPRPRLSAYHDMPYAIFWYPPEDEFLLRKEVALLKIRLEQRGKKITIISLADCLDQVLKEGSIKRETLIEAEKKYGIQSAISTVHQLLSQFKPIDKVVLSRIPGNADSNKDIVFIVRAGALFPFYRTSALLDQMQGKLNLPCVLFYPGILEGAAGLKFMGVLEAEHNYRPKIF